MLVGTVFASAAIGVAGVAAAGTIAAGGLTFGSVATVAGYAGTAANAVRFVGTGDPTDFILDVATLGAAKYANAGNCALKLAAWSVEIAVNAYQGAKYASSSYTHFSKGDYGAGAIDLLQSVIHVTGAVSRSIQAAKLDGCFPAGTPVSTYEGLKRIEHVHKDDTVWAFDLADSSWKLKRVAETFETDFVGKRVRFTIDAEEITTTEHHPIYVVEGEALDARPVLEHLLSDEPWSTPGRWVEAIDLRQGDVLLLKSGIRSKITSIQVDKAAIKVYNFEVEDLHTYAVGVAAVLVHNSCFGGKTGNHAAAARGKEAHKDYAPGESYQKEVVLDSGKRADAVDFENRIVRELKPNKPRAIARGEKQVEKYRQELQEMYGGEWKAVVDTYEP